MNEAETQEGIHQIIGESQNGHEKSFPDSAAAAAAVESYDLDTSPKTLRLSALKRRQPRITTIIGQSSFLQLSLAYISACSELAPETACLSYRRWWRYTYVLILVCMSLGVEVDLSLQDLQRTETRKACKCKQEMYTFVFYF